MNSHSLSILPLNKRVSKLYSRLNIYEDANGSLYCLKKVENSLASDRFSFLTTLKHPCLLKYYHLTDQQNGEIAEEYCPFGSLSDLIQAQHKFSANDLWCILTQLVYLFDFLLNKSLCLSTLTPSTVYICSINPIHIKLTRISRSRLLLTETTTFPSRIPQDQDFPSLLLFKFMNMLVDNLSISDSITKCSEVDHVTNLKNLSEFLKYPKSIKSCMQCNEVVTRFGLYFSSYSTPKPITITASTVFSNTLIIRILLKALTSFTTPLLVFEDNFLKCPNTQFSIFATKIINTSFHFRRLFFHAFDTFSRANDHLLTNYYSPSIRFNSVLVSVIDEEVVHTNCFINWLEKFPITVISSHDFDLNCGIFDGGNIHQLILEEGFTQFSKISTLVHLKSLTLHVYPDHLQSLSILSSCKFLSSLKISFIDYQFSGIFDVNYLSCLTQVRKLVLDFNPIQDLSPLTLLRNLASLSLKNTNVCGLCCLAVLKNLSELFLDGSKIDVFSSLSDFTTVKYLSLTGTQIYDLWPLNSLSELRFLDVRMTLLAPEHQRTFIGREEIRRAVKTFEHGVVLDLSYQKNLSRGIVVAYSGIQRLVALNLAHTCVSNYSFLCSCTELETLDLTFVTVQDELSPSLSLFSCTRLKSLSLRGFCDDLSIIMTAEQWLNLTYLDLRDVSMLPNELQCEYSSSQDILQLILFLKDYRLVTS
ncbi:hypothetical protein RCL1_007604 [Eukaryota sp. TZLM3-RCL]